MFDASYLRAKFESGDTFDAYLGHSDNAGRAAWQNVYCRSRLAEPQRRLLASFDRRINVVVLSGISCDDCAQQCPLLVRISDGNPDQIRVRFLDGGVHSDLSSRLRFNGAVQLPSVLFLAEDFKIAAVGGGRSLSRCRALASRLLDNGGADSESPLDQAEIDAMLADWLREYERVYWMLRLSDRLREVQHD